MKFEGVSAERLEQLLQSVAAGNAQALLELYDCCSPHLHSVLLRMLKHPDWAQEALQDCFIRVWQRAETYDASKGEPIAWLIGIARYRALDVLNSHRGQINQVELESVANLADEQQSPESWVEQQQGLAQLGLCLQRLQECQRRSLLLAYYEGYSHRELALAMNAPLGTVKAWIRRGLAALRACLLE